MTVMEDVEGRGHICAPDDLKELEEEGELLEFLESPFCSFAVMQFLYEKGTKDTLDRAGKLLNRLLFNEYTFPSLVSGEIVIQNGAFYPGGIVEPNRGLT